MLARFFSRFVTRARNPEPRPVAETRFNCKLCGKQAANLQLFGDSSNGGHLKRDAFTSALSDPVGADGFDALRALIAEGNARALYNRDLELASF